MTNHQNEVLNLVDQFMATQAAPPAAPPPQAPPQPPPEPPATPAAVPATRKAPEPAKAAVEATAAPRAPKAKGRKTGRPRASETEDPEQIVPVAVLMDRDLLALSALARSAMGMKLAQLVIRAAREFRDVAAELPDTPVMSTVVDDEYGEIITEAHHRTTQTPYMRARGRDVLDGNATQAGLERSVFVRRTLRAWLTVDKAFVPADTLGMLHSPAGQQDVIAKLAERSGYPAHPLPVAAGRVWAVFPLAEGTELRRAADQARGAMTECWSATQALLTVLPL